MGIFGHLKNHPPRLLFTSPSGMPLCVYVSYSYVCVCVCVFFFFCMDSSVQVACRVYHVDHAYIYTFTLALLYSTCFFVHPLQQAYTHFLSIRARNTISLGMIRRWSRHAIQGYTRQGCIRKYPLPVFL